jgi:hypothetical protein
METPMSMDNDVTQARKLAMTITTERRRFRRHSAKERRGWIGWWVHHEFHAEAVLLTNIGLGGIAVEIMSDGPREEDDVLIRLDQIKRADQCARARVISRSLNHNGHWVLRLHFTAECPAELYFATVHGLSDNESLN